MRDARQILLHAGAPVLAFALFLGLWSLAAARVDTSIGALPGPAQVAGAVGSLLAEHRAERANARAFDERMAEKRRAAEAEGLPWKDRRYTGRPTYLDQIATSLKTVFTGFLIASLVAVPLGILCGTSAWVYAALNPLIQLFRPVSPLAWLPIVMILVSALA